MKMGKGPARGGGVGQAIAMKGDRAAGEIKGAIAARADNLDAGRIAVYGRVANGCGQRCHWGLAITLQERHEAIDGASGDFRLVPLDVDDDAGFFDSAATSATRSVPVAWSARVIIGSPPKPATASEIRGSSVATMMRCSDFAVRTASTTC